MRRIRATILLTLASGLAASALAQEADLDPILFGDLGGENIEKGVIDGAVFPWDAIKGFRLENILKHHLDARVYTSCFHLVMSPKRYAELPPDVKQAIDATTGQALTDKFGDWWNKWDQAGLDAVKPLNHEIVRVDDATREKWRADLKPVIDGELAKLGKEGIANARAIYDEMRKQVARFAKK